MSEVAMGGKVRDSVSGFEGTVIGKAEFMTAVPQCLVQPEIKDGAWVAPMWLDTGRLEPVDGNHAARLGFGA